MSSDAANLDPDIAEALANAERRRGMLQQLAQIGMHLAMQIDAHAAAAMAAIYEKKAGDPAKPFATISRTVRLTLALEARVDAQILALRKGRLPSGWGASVQAAPAQRRPCEDTRHRATGEGLRSARESLVDRETLDAFEFEAEFAHYAAESRQLHTPAVAPIPHPARSPEARESPSPLRGRGDPDLGRAPPPEWGGRLRRYSG